MKRLKLITDQDILGTPGTSHAQPRVTARAIVRNPRGQYAVLCEQRDGFYCLPGGGIEPHETPWQAVRREIREETGCECTALELLGYVEENRAHSDCTRISWYFAAETDSLLLRPQFTQAEAAEETTVSWYSWQDVCRLIAGTIYPTVHRRFLQARDTAALEAYRDTYPHS